MARSKIKDIAGQVIDERYKIKGCLGQGTMGVVYEAEHILMKKRVALKMLHPSHTLVPEVVQRFRGEAQAAANIEHPNICSASDFGMYDSETYYLVMELLEGNSLGEILATQKIAEKRVLHIVKQILSALAEAHKIGVVHRDLKPDNILLIERNNDPDFVKVTDFGIAQVRLFEDSQRITQMGTVYGSPLYMSPQQALGEGVDHRADLYSVGIMLYEMLTGAVPFFAKSLTVVLSMHVTDPPKPFDEAAPEHGVSPELEAIVMKLLSKDPQDRYQDAREVINALNFLEKKKNKENPFTKIPMPIRIGVGVLFLIALLGGVLLISNYGSEDVDEEPELVFVPQEANLNKAKRTEFLKGLGIQDLEKRVLENPKKTLGEFDTLLAENPDSSHLYYLFGKAQMGDQEYKGAMRAFEKAINNDSAYISDSSLLSDVFKTFELRRKTKYQDAAELIRTTIGSHAAGRLAEIAEHHRKSRVRKRALALLKEMKEFEKLEKWNQLTITLRHAVSCEDNRSVIVEIGELGNPKALSALRRFDSNSRSGCKGKDCYKCARDDVRVGIERLEAAQK